MGSRGGAGPGVAAFFGGHDCCFLYCCQRGCFGAPCRRRTSSFGSAADCGFRCRKCRTVNNFGLAPLSNQRKSSQQRLAGTTARRAQCRCRFDDSGFARKNRVAKARLTGRNLSGCSRAGYLQLQPGNLARGSSLARRPEWHRKDHGGARFAATPLAILRQVPHQRSRGIRL